jgi:CubicO group peptidase (beta-lactamase class C family)
VKHLAAFILALALLDCAAVAPAAAPVHAQAGVAFDRGGDIASFAEGTADRRSGRLVTIDDPVRVASISKMVTAIGVMKLVDQGRLDLTSDVSRWLGWTLRNPNFPDQPITLSMLLSHTASVREHDDDYAIPFGGSLRQVMADPKNWDSQHGPGDRFFAYANLNYPIVGSIIERVTGGRFDIWMRRTVLQPMRLDACFNWATCSNAAVARAVELDDPGGNPLKDDLHGQRPGCPVLVKEGEACDLNRWTLGENGALFAPQGGLRISARGLARIGRMLLNGGKLDGVRLLSPEAVKLLLTQVWTFDGTNGETDGGFYCSAGNGTHWIPNRGCADDLAGDGTVFVGHAGDAYGMKSGLWLDLAHHRGIAYFVTGLPDPAPKAAGSAYADAEVRTFRRALGLFNRRVQRAERRSRQP